MPEGNKQSGALPDGVFDANTKLWFCCRDDGPYSSPISLPIDRPFILLQNSESNYCQTVEGGRRPTNP
jgi:hypothetical protein